MLNKYPVPHFVYLQCILTQDGYANQDSERLNQYWWKYEHVAYGDVPVLSV